MGSQGAGGGARGAGARGAMRLGCHPERESRDLGLGWGARHVHVAPPAQVPRLTLGMTGGRA
jgi:hypothetical protein